MGAVKLRVRENGVNFQEELSRFCNTLVTCKEELLFGDDDCDPDFHPAYDRIARGCYANVYSSRCGNYVFKAIGYGTKDKAHDGYLDWLSLCLDNQGKNPLIPRILGVRMFKEFTVVMLDQYMETIQGWADGNCPFDMDGDYLIIKRLKGIYKAFRERGRTRWIDEVPLEYGSQKFSKLYYDYAIELIDLVEERGFCFQDLHTENYMVDINGKITILDPMSRAKTKMDEVTHILKNMGVL